MAARPLTLEERKALAAMQRGARIASREPTLAEMRAQRVARVSGLPPTPMATPPGLSGPVYLPEHMAYVVPREPLDERRRMAQRHLGLQPAGLMRGDEAAPDAKALVPATYRPLAGLSPNQRGGKVSVDSTKYNVATSSLPLGSPGFFPRNTLVQALSPGDDAEHVSIALGFNFNTPLVSGSYTGFDPRVYGEVIWGVGGAEFKASFDWINGTVLTLPANYVRVVAIVPDNSASSFTPPHVAPIFELAAGISYGSPPAHANRARYSVPLAAALAADTDVTVEIPNFAIGFSVQGPTASLPINLTQSEDTSGGAGAVVNVENVFSGNQNSSDQKVNTFPVANGAQFLRVRSSGGATLAQVVIVFDLAF